MELKMFNVRLPIGLITRLRKHSLESGIKIWRVVTDALTKYLDGVKK